MKILGHLGPQTPLSGFMWVGNSHFFLAAVVSLPSMCS